MPMSFTPLFMLWAFSGRSQYCFGRVTGGLDMWRFLLLIFSFLFSFSSQADTIPARVKPNTWGVLCSGTTTSGSHLGLKPQPDSGDATCNYLCQNDYVFGSPLSTVEARRKQSGFMMPFPGPDVYGINSGSKITGYCMCNNGSSTYVYGGSTYFSGCSDTGVKVGADVECEIGSPILAYSPATCYYAGSTTQQPSPSACAVLAGQSIYKMLAMVNGAYQGAGCFAGCEYQKPLMPQIYQANNVSYATGFYTATGKGCLAQAGALIDVPDGAVQATTFATEGTQLMVKSLLQQILDKLGVSGSGSGGGSGGTNTGGDLARTATATEAVSSALTPSNAASAASVQAEGEAAIQAGASTTVQSVADSLPQETVNFGEALSGVTVSVFGAGSCPAPVNMFSWNGQPVTFNFETFCQYAVALSFLVVAAASIKAFGIAMGN